MKSSKSRRRSLRRQWSVDVPSTIQKKFREVTRRSKSLDDDVSKQRLLKDDIDSKLAYSNDGAVENFGGDESELHCSSRSSSWHSSDEESNRKTSSAWQKIDDIQIEVENYDVVRNSQSESPRDSDYLSVSTASVLSTIDEASPRSPTKRTSPHDYEGDVNKGKDEVNVPRKFARNEFSNTDAETRNIDPEGRETAPAERHRRHAICEEMERYIIVDQKGHSLRKYRETLIRHRVLKELCLL